MQEGEAVKKVFAQKMQASRQTRGAKWPAKLGRSLQIPNDCSSGDLAEVLEFLHVRPGRAPPSQ